MEKWTPEQLKNQAERTKSDAELIKGGARYKSKKGGESRLEVTKNQIEEIRETEPEDAKASEEEINANFEKYKEETDQKLKSFPSPDNFSEEDLRKLKTFILFQGYPERFGEVELGKFAEKIGLPTDISMRRWYGRGASDLKKIDRHSAEGRREKYELKKDGYDEEYRVSGEARERAIKMLQEIRGRIEKLVLEVGDEFVKKYESTFKERFPDMPTEAELNSFRYMHHGDSWSPKPYTARYKERIPGQYFVIDDQDDQIAIINYRNAQKYKKNRSIDTFLELSR